jgi:hypothetical protein
VTGLRSSARRAAALPFVLLAGFVLAGLALVVVDRPWDSLGFSTWPSGFEAGRIARNLHAGLGYASPFLALPGDSFLVDPGDARPGIEHPQIQEVRPGDSPTAWVTPPYVALWWLAFAWFGVYTPAAAAAFQVAVVLLIAAALFLAWRLVHRLRGEHTALLALVLLIVYPSTWYFAIEDRNGTALFLALLLLSLLALERAVAGARGAGAAFGACAALAVLTEPASLFFYLWLVPWAAFKVVRRERGRRLLAASALACALVWGPWLLRNLVVLRAPVPFKSNLPMELFYGNNADSLGNIRTAHEERFPGWNERERMRLLEVGEPAYARECLLRFAMFLHEQPLAVARLTFERITFYWSYNPYRVSVWRPALTLLFHLALGLWLFVTFGVRLPGADWFETVLGGYFALAPLIYYATHLMIYRYRYPLEALVLIAAASAWGRLRGWDQPNVVSRVEHA